MSLLTSAKLVPTTHAASDRPTMILICGLCLLVGFLVGLWFAYRLGYADGYDAGYLERGKE